MKKLLIITDTTEKQTNGVVRTLKNTMEILSKDFDIQVIGPENFTCISLPFYKEIDISLNTWKIGKMIEEANADFIHLITEGPVGLAGKLYCDRKDYNYTTSYHSKFPEFLKDMMCVPVSGTYPYFKWFHSKSKNVLVPTQQVKKLLEGRGFTNIKVWMRGVDKNTFNPRNKRRVDDSVLKIILCVSRVSKEKGLDDFCQIPVPDGYLKVLVGDGPYLNELMHKYHSEAVAFAGKRVGEDLAETYANADVFVFPSRNDTFGLTQLEAIASGTPVLAYRGTVSEEIIVEGKSGYLVDEFTIEGIQSAMKLSRVDVAKEGDKWTWEKCTEIFRDNLVPKK